MNKLSDSLLNMTVVLTATAIVTGGILAFVNSKTEGPISEVKQKELTEGIVNVIGDPNLTVTANDSTKDSNGKDIVIHRVADKDGNSLGAAVESSTMGFGGELKVLTGFDNDGNILGYAILTSSETPGLGAKADKWFQKDGKGSIISMNPGKNNMTVSKDGGEVDAITASTITSRAFLGAVNSAYKAVSCSNADAQSCATKNANDNQTTEQK